MKVTSNKTIYLTDIVNYQYTSPKANELEILRSYDQSVMNLNNSMSQNYNITQLPKFKKTSLKLKSK